MPFEKGKSGNPRGRPPGPNRFTKELREMILGALDGAGGEAYLKRQAEENPGPFLALVGKCLPKNVNLEAGDKVLAIIERRFVKGEAE